MFDKKIDANSHPRKCYEVEDAPFTANSHPYLVKFAGGKNYYTKEEIDGMIAGGKNYYTKEEIDGMINSYDSNNDGIVDAADYAEDIDWSLVINKIYPVGSIYISTTLDTVAKVKAAFGGTWVAWGSGRVPVGVDTTQTEFDTVEETGGTKFTSYTPAGSNTGTAVTMSAITLTHSGGAVGNHKLVESELPKISGSWAIHGQENGTIFYHAYGHCTGTIFSNKYTYTNAVTGASSLQNPGFSFGGDGSHNHGFTQPSQHSFTPTTKSVTNPTFTGTAANISTVQPYITCYMYKRTA